MFGLDDWTERQFLRYASPGIANIESTDLRLVVIDPVDNGPLGEFTGDAWRGHHARMIDRLRGAGAPVVAFDLFFPSPDEANVPLNELFAQAVSQSRSSGTTEVIIGVNKRDRVNETLTAVMPIREMALVNIRRTTESTTETAFDTRVVLAEAYEADGPVTSQRLVRPLSIPLAIYLAHEGLSIADTVITIDSSRRKLVIQQPDSQSITIEVEIEMCATSKDGCEASFEEPKAHEKYLVRALLPFWIQDTTGFNPRRYDEVLGRENISDFAGKTAIIGAMTEEEKVNVGPTSDGTTIYGFHIVAQVVSDLIRGTYLRKVGAAWQFGIIVLMVIFGTVASLKLPKTEIPVPIIVKMSLPFGFFIVTAVFLLAVLFVFRNSRHLLDLNYHLLALVAGYFVIAPRIGPAKGNSPIRPRRRWRRDV